jgi:hypothetical protein
MDFPDRKELKNKKIQDLKKKGLLMDENPNKYIEEDGFDRSVEMEVTEDSKSYSWTRLYLSDETDLEKGDIVTLTYQPTGEQMELIFATYNKSSLTKDQEDVVDYNPEEDKKVLCLMVDIDEVNNNIEIPFLRTLFKSSKWYDHQLLKRNELKFEVKGEELDYYSVDF